MTQTAATEIRDVENALRSFITTVLSDRFGEAWLEKCGVSPDRLESWRNKREAEEKRLTLGGVVEPRLIYYADFYDLWTILNKHWNGPFSDAFGKKRTMEAYMDTLETLRNAEAHGRVLVPHQTKLAIGIAGDIRSRLVRYRSKMESDEDVFPLIERVCDNFGNIWTPEGAGRRAGNDTILRPGDTLEFVVTARDPEDLPLEYGLFCYAASHNFWGPDSTLVFRVTEELITAHLSLTVMIRSPRPYHGQGSADDFVNFGYKVFPLKRT